ncbi:hypothetical protein CDAR_483281, partial [Caerostris darwini]
LVLAARGGPSSRLGAGGVGAALGVGPARVRDGQPVLCAERALPAHRPAPQLPAVRAAPPLLAQHLPGRPRLLQARGALRRPLRIHAGRFFFGLLYIALCSPRKVAAVARQ